MESTFFPAKILLFGEYTVLLDSKALAIPYPQFSGKLELFGSNNSTVNENKLVSNNVLYSFCSYIRKTIQETELYDTFDIVRFELELKSGLYFQSNIPNGCGLGSSGALTAAIYHRYRKQSNRSNPVNLSIIQKHLAYLESFFHKSSSGIDPLVSYCNYPLLLENGDIVKVGIPESFQTEYAVELFDTGKDRKTGNLMGDFLNNCEEGGYLNLIRNELIVANNECIDAIIEGDTSKLFESLKLLSNFQFTHFKSLIPDSVLPLWEKGLKTGNYFKLCGAGGGGYLLSFSRIKNEIRNKSRNEFVRSVHPDFLEYP